MIKVEEMRHFTTETQRENEGLYLMVKSLRQINSSLTNEIKHLREALALSQREQDSLKQQVHNLKMSGVGGGGGNGLVGTAVRRAPMTGMTNGNAI